METHEWELPWNFKIVLWNNQFVELVLAEHLLYSNGNIKRVDCFIACKFGENVNKFINSIYLTEFIF